MKIRDVVVVILAGGKGTRLGKRLPPKAMLRLNGKTLIDRQLEWLYKQGFRKVIVAMGHRWKEINPLCTQKMQAEMQISKSVEDVPLGSAGAVNRAIIPFLRTLQGVYVLNVDDLVRVNAKEMIGGNVPCVLVVPAKFSAVDVLHGRYMPRGDAWASPFAHVGHTYLPKHVLFALPATGDLEREVITNYRVDTVTARDWLTINTPADLREARKKIKTWNRRKA